MPPKESFGRVEQGDEFYKQNVAGAMREKCFI
jgi:hypothetical protein